MTERLTPAEALARSVALTRFREVVVLAEERESPQVTVRVSLLRNVLDAIDAIEAGDAL